MMPAKQDTLSQTSSRQRLLNEFFQEVPNDKQRLKRRIRKAPATNNNSADASIMPRIAQDNLCDAQRRKSFDEESDIEMAGNITEDDFVGIHMAQPSQDHLQLSQFSHHSRFSQDDCLDFLTPQDQPVIHLSGPTTPSPLKKKYRRNGNTIDNDMMHITEDMVVLDVCSNDSSQPVQGPVWDLNNHHLREEDQISSDGLEMNEKICSSRKLRRIPTGPTNKQLDTPMVKAQRRQPGFRPASIKVPEVNTNPFEPKNHEKRKRGQRTSSVTPAGFPPAWQSSNNFSRYLYDFVELELIGSGSFSRVYKCIKRIDGWTYAIKKSKKRFHGNSDRQRGLREVYALAALGHCNNIVRYFNSWIEDEILYIQTEICNGGSLSDKFNEIVQQAKLVSNNTSDFVPFPEITLCTVLMHIAKALDAIHSIDLAHMDIKPSNIFLSDKNIYKLGDFGNVAKIDGSMEIVEGDNRYLAREILVGNRSYLQAGDIFALGATLYELALGKSLSGSGEEWQHLRDGHLLPLRFFSNSLQNLLTSMMHPDPLQRPKAYQIMQHEILLPLSQGNQDIKENYNPNSNHILP